MKIVLFASGRGSNALNLINCAKKDDYQVVGLIVDNPKAPILKKIHDIPVKLIEKFGTRWQHEQEILAVLSAWDFDYICLAGYQRILSTDFVEHFLDKKTGRTRILNIHPSLLPAYPGLNSYRRAFEDGAMETGVTVHFVDQGVDTGPIILQKSFERQNHDNYETFESRGLELEHKLYPQALSIVRRSL